MASVLVLKFLALLIVCELSGTQAQSCEITSYYQCQGYLDQVEGQTDPEVFCPKLLQGENCLKKLMDTCDNAQVLQMTNMTLSALRNNLAICHQTTDNSHSPCSMELYYQCLTPLAGLESETDPAVSCPKLQEGQRCLEDLRSHCTDLTLIATIQSTLGPMMPGIVACAGGTMPPMGDCSWEEYGNCAMPMTGLENENDLGVLCPKLRTGEKCLHGVIENCIDGMLINTSHTLIKVIGSGLMYCPDDHEDHDHHDDHDQKDDHDDHDDDKDDKDDHDDDKDHHSCSEDDVRHCEYDLQDMHDKAHQCRNSRKAQQCLYDVHEWCDHPEVKAHIREQAIPRVDMMIQQCEAAFYDTGSGSSAGDNNMDFGSSAGALSQNPLFALSLAFALLTFALL